MSEFALKLEPTERIAFTGKKLGEEPANMTLKISNPSKERLAYKVKCTSNEMFRIRPPVGALKPGENVNVQLVFNGGKSVPDSGKHYFAVYYIKATDEKKAPRAVWSDHKGEPTGTKRLYVDFKKEGEAGDKKDEKKEDEKKEEDKKDDDKKEEKKEDEKKDDDKKEEKKDDEKKDAEKKDEDKKDEDKKDGDDKKEDEKKDACLSSSTGIPNAADDGLCCRAIFISATAGTAATPGTHAKAEAATTGRARDLSKDHNSSKIHYISSELLTTELTYMRELQTVVDNYIRPFEDVENPKMIPSDIPGRTQLIFGNIREIHEFHQKYIDG